MFRSFDETRNVKNHTSIWRFVISGGIMQLIELMEKVYNSDSKIVGVNTDCVYYLGGDRFHGELSDNAIDNIGKYRVEVNIRPKMYNKFEYDTLDMNNFVKKIGTGTIIEGKAGLGKSHKCHT